LIRYGVVMGRSKKPQMRTFDDDWADQIWRAVCMINGGKGALWALPLAALAVTGCRPANLERGIAFALVKHEGKTYIEATIKGVKLTSTRGQPEYKIRWGASDTHRESELLAIAESVAASPQRRIVVKYDAEAISTRLRELSEKLWPRRKNKITAYCYRELLSSTAKSAGAPAEELALALGHLSTESQGRYARGTNRGKPSKKPWASVQGDKPVRSHRSPMVRFRAASAIKKAKERAPALPPTKRNIRRAI
jgi:hypothetical protein